MSAPLTYAWDGEHFTPLARHAKLADQHFVVGETYQLDRAEVRSAISHRHYFASIHEAWLNLPETVAERFPTDEHLRKWALVKCGFADERSIVCASKAEARRIAAFIQPMDQFAVVIVREATIKVFTPQSQSIRAMGRAQFQASKDAVLAAIAELVGVEPRALETERAA